MVAQTRRQAAATQRPTESPSASASAKGRASKAGRDSSKPANPPRPERRGPPPAWSASSQVSPSLDRAESGSGSAATPRPLPEVPTIPLFDFDVLLEQDASNGSRLSLFNPAPYESLRSKLQLWYPDLSRQDDDPSDPFPIGATAPSSQVQSSSDARQSNASKKNRRNTLLSGIQTTSSNQPLESPKPGSQAQQSQKPSKSRKRNGKAKQPDFIHLEVEFVPQLISEGDLLVDRNVQGSSSMWFPKPRQAFAVVALSPLDFKPVRTKLKNVTIPEAGPAAQDDHQQETDDEENELNTLLLGHIVPSALKDTAHPLAHLDPALVSKEWVQMYGEVTLAPPFLPPATEVFGPDASRTAWKYSATPFNGSTSPAKEAEPGRRWARDGKLLQDRDTDRQSDAPGSVPSTRILGVLSVQVGLEPAALQYGAGDTKADGFVASNDDLKDTGAEGSLNLARALRQAIPAIVDWKHSFVELDSQSHTFWDRNESFYDLPSKQSTLARHLVLDKVVPVDFPPSSKSGSKKRKKAPRSSRNHVWSATGTGEDDEDEAISGLGHYCFCPNCRDGLIPAAAPVPETPRTKSSALPLGEKVSSTDLRLGDPANPKFLPLDTNVASLLEACRPPSDGPKVYPPTDMIPTPLLGYQARCLAWMIKRETIVDEDVDHLMPNWFPLRCKNATEILRRRMQLEAEREAHLDSMQRGLSRSRRNVNVKTAQAAATAALTAAAAASADTQSGDVTPSHFSEQNSTQHGGVLKREPFIDPVETTFYFDQVSGLLSLRRFSCRQSEPGGALCESMGLGKTLESLSLIAAHPRPDTEDLLSYDVSRSARMIAEMDPRERPFVSRATLVVCPAALVEQWMDEIRKHFRSRHTSVSSVSGELLNQQPGVVRYRHVDFAWDAQSPRGDVRSLAKEGLTQPDIVVATYEELAFQLSESHRVQRSGDQVRTPLLEVLFWRILLDEAQIVAGASGKATEMVHELWRSNCWMVTGTPVTKGIRDIQGIFAFLDHDPFAAPRFFREILQEPFSRGCLEGIRRMRSILPRFVWRHTQAHVEEEIVLPPCKSEVLEIDLKHVERLFYDKEVNKYREMFAKRAAQGTATVSQPTFLVNLRQLLSHPQIADQLMFSNNYSRLSFAELFRRFCLQAQSELDSIRMQVVTSTLQLVWGHDFYDAEEDKRRWRGGRRALKQSEDILKALNSALRVVNTALDDQSLARATPLSRIHDAEDDVGMEDSKAADVNFTDEAVAPTDADAHSPSSGSSAVNIDQQAWGGADTAARVNLTWEEASYWLQTLLRRHADISSEEVGGGRMDEIEPPARWDPERPTRTFFEKEFKNATDKGVDLNDPRFHLVVQDAGAEDMCEDELMAQIEAERKGKGSSGSTRKKQRKDPALEPGLLKKSRLRGNATQRKQARVWLYKPKERLEKTHARLLSQQKSLPSKEHEVAFLRQKLLELQAAESDTDPNYELLDSNNPASAAECQICYEPKEQIGVLPCYHSFCIDCIETICEKSSHWSTGWYDRPRCPSCRLEFHPDRVTRVMERGRSASTDGGTNVIGDWSGKISGLILDLKKRLGHDPTNKAVIFSHWPKMLAFVRDALVQNDITAVIFGGNEVAQAEALRAIRDDDHVNVIMVPFRASAGAAGLTLTTCNLAYLMEPALDAALEAQAVGRIHRIGQRRETTIIRVKMKDTIEDAVMRIADERSRRGMALAAHVDPSTAVATKADVEPPVAPVAAEGLGPSTSRNTETLAQSGSIGSVRTRAEESNNRESAPSTSNLRERSIKSSVAASVGAARESDSTSLTMVEVGLILGFNVDEEKRKARERRESLMARAYDYGFSPSWIDRLTDEALDDIERDMAMFDEEDEDDLDDGFDDQDEVDWPLPPDSAGHETILDRQPESSNQVQVATEVPETSGIPSL